MILATCLRRFCGTNGALPVEATMACDLPTVPAPGVVVVFQDGSGVAVVSAVRFSAWPSPRAAGVYPGAVGVRFADEPVERLPAVLAAGWVQPAEVVYAVVEKARD